jgi:hypothetical protein
MGNRRPGKLIEIRNLLAENDMYQLFEFTFLRQQVIVIREVTTKASIYSQLAQFLSIFKRRPVPEKLSTSLLEDKSIKFL